MKLHNLKPAPGSIKGKKRVGRGIGSGSGKTSGRGQKGQKSRSGKGKGVGFEGGQNPLARRLPKLPGFKNPFRKEYACINVEKLNVFKENSQVDPKLLKEKEIVKKKLTVKILGDGDLKKALKVKAHAFSQSARKKIEKAGGKVEVI